MGGEAAVTGFFASPVSRPSEHNSTVRAKAVHANPLILFPFILP